MISFESLRPWLLCGLALFLVASGWRWRTGLIEQGRVEVQALWDAERVDIAEQSLKVELDRERKGATMILAYEAQRKVKDARIANLGNELAAALGSLSNRPDRPDQSAGGVPGDPATGSVAGCTGASLYRTDAAFLVREAARADQLRIDHEQCQAAYSAARDALK